LHLKRKIRAAFSKKVQKNLVAVIIAHGEFRSAITDIEVYFIGPE